jgi:radical SAM family protein/iron-sulfur cluster protein
MSASADKAAPPAASQAPLYCEWLWNTVTVLCDGTVTCGLDDPFKLRNHGSLKSSSLREIFAAAPIQKRREELLSGKKCFKCTMYTSAEGREPIATTSTPYPRRIVLESTIKCNIRCINETCNIANDSAFHLRREDFMQWPLFTKLMDEVGPHLKQLLFYNYGEPFAHPRALDMLAYAKKVNPNIRTTTSTNGILLAREGLAERIVEEALVDWICFTIGGVDQETYGRYHKAGSFEKAMTGMRRLVEAKKRAGKSKPTVHWRYLVFHWNDSDECIAEALRLREEIGMDEFKFMLTASPIDGRSLRRAPGTPGFEAIKPWLGYQDFYNADPYLEAGLWALENSPRLGPFAWTGRTARVCVKPVDGQVNLRLARSTNPVVPQQTAKLRLPWGEDLTANVGAGQWGDNPIPVPRGFGGDDVQITVEVDQIFSPLRHTETHDNRELGIMVCMEGVSVAPNPFRTTEVSSERIRGMSR